MLLEIGSVNNVPAYVKRVKAGEKLLMGFGHRVYKNYDPRAKIVKRIAYEVFDIMGRNPLIDIALECERIALEDEYFVKRRLYPNVDFYTGLIYQSMGFPVTMFPVLFAIPRTSGWIAQWEEMLLDPEQKIARPRQVYHGLRSAQLYSARSPGLRVFADAAFRYLLRMCVRALFAAPVPLKCIAFGHRSLAKHCDASERLRYMDISTRQVGNATIVDVVGDITLYNSPEVRKSPARLAEGQARAARDRES